MNEDEYSINIYSWNGSSPLLIEAEGYIMYNDIRINFYFNQQWDNCYFSFFKDREDRLARKSINELGLDIDLTPKQEACSARESMNMIFDFLQSHRENIIKYINERSKTQDPWPHESC